MKDAFNAYLASVSQIPVIPHEEMVELFKKGDSRSKKKIIEGNLRLVIHVAKTFKKRSIDSSWQAFNDLVQEGNIGLMKAVDRFDHTKGFRFSTYATWWIKQSIGQYLMNKRKNIRLPAHAAHAQKKMIEVIEDFKREFDCEPTMEELSALLGVSETVLKAASSCGARTVSIDHPAFPGGDNERTVGDSICDDSSSPFDTLAELELIELALEVLETLSDREMAIIRLRFGLVPKDDDQYVVDDVTAAAIEGGEGMYDDD